MNEDARTPDDSASSIDSQIQLQLDKIADEYLNRRRKGEQPGIEEFTARFPGLADLIQQTLETIQFIDDLNAPLTSTFAGVVSGSSELQPEITDFRIIRKIGQGGMGVVFEAEQESLGRRVALKILPSHLSKDEKFVERFQREARAAANLHHTNIVPVFEVGQQGETLFYAMQYIEGLPLDEVQKEVVRLKEQGTETSQSSISKLMSGSDSGSTSSRNQRQQNYYKSIAKLGADIADALGYAHDRSIIHRDVKPSNLILDTEGVVWLADFGLAKTTDSELTETGDFLGTARYMSPERFKGQADQRGDIYGLGITLFELATLRRPFDAPDRLQLIDQIANAEPRRPGEIDRHIPLDLETIILKSMEKDPRRRYQNATEMALDLRRFVDDQPIHARRASAFERLTRWVRKNKAQTAAMVSMAVGILILVVSTVLIQQQRDIANANFEEAEKQKLAADKNFQLAFDSVDKFYTKISEETLLNEPGMESLRMELLNSAGDFFDEFTRLRKGDSDVRLEYIAARYRQAKIAAEIGSTDHAIKLLGDVIAESKSYGFEKDNADFLFRMVLIHQAHGSYLLDQGQTDEGLSSLTEGATLADRLVEVEPGNWEYQVAAGVAHGKQVRIYADKGDFETALELAIEARSVFDRLSVEELDEFEVWNERGLATRVIGAIYAKMGKYESAIACFKDAIEDFRRALLIRPQSAKVKRYIAHNEGGMALMQTRIGLNDESLTSNLRAIKTFEELATSYPMAAAYKHELGNRYASLGSAYWQKGDYEAAKKNYLIALEYRQKLVDAHPKQLSYLIRLGRIFQNIGLTNGNLDNDIDQEHYYLKAIEIGKKVCQMEPDNPRLLSDLSRYRSGLSNLYVAQKRFDEAERLLDDSIESATTAHESTPQVVELGIAVLEASVSLGELKQQREQFDKAIEVFDSGLKVGLDSLDRANQNQVIMRQLWAGNLSRADCLFELGRYQEALDGKLAAIPFAVNPQKEWVAKLEAKQLELFLGRRDGVTEYMQEVPTDLVNGDVRINKELAYLVAAGSISVQKNETLSSARKSEMLDELEVRCLGYVKSARELGAFLDRDSVDELLNHPYFTEFRSRPAFQRLAVDSK